MTTMTPITLVCPNCHTHVESQQLMSTNQVGTTTELRPRTMGADPLQYLIHSCQNCGFTGDDAEFKGNVDSAVARRIEEEILPNIRDERSQADSRWEFAAMIAEWRGQSAQNVGQFYLNAAWCADESEKEIYYRRRAADWFERALDSEVDNRAVLLYRIGELYRRVDDIPVAHQWFDAAIKGAEGHAQADRIRELANQQKTNPQEYL